MKVDRKILEALTGLFIAAKYKDRRSIEYRAKECDKLDITNYAQNICMREAVKDKTVGTNDSQILAVMQEAGERLTGRATICNSILVAC